MSGPQHSYFSSAARRLGMVSGWTLVGLGIIYGAVLAAGLISLDSPQQPIRDPLFTLMELLILLMTPAMVGLMAAVHAWAPPRERATSLVALSFMTLAAGLTAIVHFSILTLSRQPPFADADDWAWLLSFRWPSLAYALDVLAWDIFFALAMLFAAPAFGGTRLASAVRAAMIASALFALGGLAGVVSGDMQIRNIGIIGYLALFIVAAGLLASLFQRTPTNPEGQG